VREPRASSSPLRSRAQQRSDGESNRLIAKVAHEGLRQIGIVNIRDLVVG
jgi:hypothetical protein